jgi:lysylphosphatidylglycerol synthetase-like protein (DUF2156 family)
VADEEQEVQRGQETLKLHFEFFKHFTTLSGAAAVVIMAIYKEGIAEQKTLLILSLVMFGLAVAVAVYAIVMVMGVFGLGKALLKDSEMALLYSLVVVVSVLFAAGLGTFLLGALGPTFATWVIAVLCLMSEPAVEDAR